MVVHVVASVAFALWTTYAYILFSWIDYARHEATYHASKHLPRALRQTLWNTVVVVPLSTLALLLLCPPGALVNPLWTEAVHGAVQYVCADVWMYSFHRLVHCRRFYWLHKQHHELRTPLGALALYGHPLDAVYVNTGGVFVVHAVLRTSWVHLFLLFSGGLANTIFISHSGGVVHDAHHKKHNVNYGFDFFMDRLCGTHARTQ